MATKRTYAPKDPKGLAGVTIAWIWILNAVSVAAAAALGFQVYTLIGRDPALNIPAHPTEYVTEVQTLAGMLELLWLAVLVISGIISLKWIYRTNANAHALAPGLPNSPPWAVGWFFVPLANLFKPYQSMQQTWRVSARAPNRRGQDSSLVKWWWAMWIISSIASNAAGRFQDETSVRGLITGDIAQIVSFAIDVIMNFVFMALVADLTRIQVRRLADHEAAPVQAEAQPV